MGHSHLLLQGLTLPWWHFLGCSPWPSHTEEEKFEEKNVLVLVGGWENVSLAPCVFSRGCVPTPALSHHLQPPGRSPAATRAELGTCLDSAGATCGCHSRSPSQEKPTRRLSRPPWHRYESMSVLRRSSPQKLWLPHPSEGLRPAWTGLGATWDSWKMSFKVTSNPKHSTILGGHSGTRERSAGVGAKSQRAPSAAANNGDL